MCIRDSVATDCSGTDKVIGVQSNGTVLCASDQTGAGGNVKSGDGVYLYNDTDTIYFNSTLAETDLEVNGSDYWDNYDTTNSTWFENVGGILNIKVSYFTTLWNSIFGTKTTDDLTEGSTNLYDNSSWNQTLANTIYLNLSGGNANQNIDIGNYNLTADYFIGDGSQLTGISSNVEDGTASGQLVFWDGSSEYKHTETSELVWDDTNKRLGIGTGSPQNELNVIGDGNFTGTIYSNGNSVLTSYSETDPYWTSNQSSYSTTAEILAFGYYNSSDFVITDYFTKSQIENFGYYNSSDFNIADYFTSAEVLAFNYYNSSDFDINDYVTSATLLGYNYYNSSDFDINDYYTSAQIEGFNYWNDTHAGFNKSYADTLYADISVTDTNCSVDDSCENIAYDSEINKTYVDNQDSNQDECSEITGCVENAITDGNTNWDNSYGFFNSILNFTGTLTNNKICIYDSSQGIINCSYTDQTGASGNPKAGDGIYLYNDTNTIYLNETKLNETINNEDDDTIYTSEEGLIYLDGTEFKSNMTIFNNSVEAFGYSTESGTVTSVATDDTYLTGGVITTSGTITFNETLAGTDLAVNSSNYWDNLDSPSDINAGDITDDGTYRLQSWDNLTGIPHATPSNGDTTHFSLADEIYDWVIGLAYATTTYVNSLGNFSAWDKDYNDLINTPTYTNDTWVDTYFVRFTELVSQVGNWSNDKSDYWNSSTDLDTVISDDEIAEGKISFSTACAAGDYYRLSGNDLECTTPTDTNAGTICANGEFLNGDGSCDAGYLDADGVDSDTQLTEDQVEAYVFDSDNTANLGLNGYNVTNISYSTFCNGANCWKMYVNASDYFIIEEI